MKISQIIRFLELLKNGDLTQEWLPLFSKIVNLQSVIINNPIQIADTGEKFSQNVADLEQTIKTTQETIDILRTQLRQAIQQHEPEYYLSSLRLYEEEMRWETNDYILNRKLVSTVENDQVLRARVKSSCDWRLPGMIIRPGLDSYIEDMVPLDPLYVVDQHLDLINPAISKFTEQYQRRLRPYVINDYQQSTPLQQLPDNQFGSIFAHNFFNYKPIEVIEIYLNEFRKKLRPGGTVIFTYNDCDYSNGVGLAENNFMCYTPGHRIRTIATDIGFTIVNHVINLNNLQWIELRRPGEITTLRGGQTLAKISFK
jgi:hypothetical protein